MLAQKIWGGAGDARASVYSRILILGSLDTYVCKQFWVDTDFYRFLALITYIHIHT